MRIISFFLILILTFAFVGEANAFRFSPFRAKFEPSGPEANKLFTVENNSDQPASVEIRVTTRKVDVSGVEKNENAEKDFVVYPAQLVLKPRESRTVRIQWAGDPELKEEKAMAKELGLVK